MFNLGTLFKRTAPDPPDDDPLAPARARWIARFSEPQVGHAVDAAQAVNQSFGEAQSLFDRGVVQPRSVVLDLGSGNGRQAIGLLEHGIEKYVGIEPVKACVEFSNRTFRDYPQCEFIWLDLKNETYNPGGAIDPLELRVPFDEGYFDAVLAGSLFTHLGAMEVCNRYLSEAHRVLKPGGRLFCSWFRSPPNELSSGHDRSVFPEAEIITAVTKHFTVYHSKGGTSAGYHDQWRLYCRK